MFPPKSRGGKLTRRGTDPPKVRTRTPTLSPYFFVENGDPAVDGLSPKQTKAKVHIASVITDVVVTQIYRNARRARGWG